MMVDPQRLPHAPGRAGAGEQGDGEREGEPARSAAARSPPPPPSPPASAAGARPRPRSVSAVRPPNKGVNSSFSPAIGRSTSRDQWMLEPARRCCCEIVPALARRAGRGPASSAYCRRCRRARSRGSRPSGPRACRRRRRARTASTHQRQCRVRTDRAPATRHPFPSFSSPSSGISRSPQRASGREGGGAWIMERRGALKTLFGQLIRFGMVGGFVTVLYALVYSPLAELRDRRRRMLANLLGYCVAMVRLCPAQPLELPRPWQPRQCRRGRTGRFFIVSLVSLGLNACSSACSPARSRRPELVAAHPDRCS